MAVEIKEGFVCIRQLQGVKGEHFNGALQQWPVLCVEACIAFAQRQKLKGVRIYRADQSLFYKYPLLDLSPETPVEEFRKKVSMHQEKMRRRYDGLAESLGFTMKKKYGELVL